MTGRVMGVASLIRDLGEWRSDGPNGRPAYRKLADGIRLLIHDGRIPLGTALPSERDLASALGLSRTTVTSTYATLRDEGYLVSRQGSRSTVALPPSARPNGLMFQAITARTDCTSGIDLSYAAMTAPDAVADAYAAALQALPAYLSTHGMEPIGTAALREVIAERYRRRGLPTEPEQIMVTLGAQHALRLLLAALLAPGERVLIDHPTYPNAIEAIRSAGGRPVPVPLRPEDGIDAWDVDGIRSAARQTAARMAYLVPDFNNPTGMCMAEAQRPELAAVAHDTRMTLVVDESMAELNLDIDPPTPVAAFGRHEEIVTIGSASKSIWGGLRIGWIRASRALVTRLANTRSAVDLGTPVMDQLAAALLLADLEPILAERRALLRTQRAALHAALADHLPDWQPLPGVGGMSAWIRLPAAVSTALAATAPNFGVLLVAGPRFGVEGSFERFLRVPYVRSAEELQLAAAALAGAYEVVAPRAGATETPIVCV